MKKLLFTVIAFIVAISTVSCSGVCSPTTGVSVNLSSNNGGVTENQINVNLQPLFELQFSVPMDPATINDSTILLSSTPLASDAQLMSITNSTVELGKISASNDNTTFSFTTAVPLNPSQKYYLYINNVKTATNIGVSSSFSFTTSPVNFVAVGTNSTILYSTNGSQWIVESLGISQYFNGVSYADNQFVAVGSDGVIYTSHDGVNWAAQVSNTSQELFETTYGNSLFVTVGCNGTVITSPNAIDWTTQITPTICDLYSVTYGNGYFVATGQYSSGSNIFTSPDGLTWTPQPSTPTYNELTAVTYGNGKYIAVGMNGVIVTATESDNWVTAASSEIATTDQLAAVIYADNKYIALARSGGVILNSTDADNWNAISINNSNLMYGLGYGMNKFFAVGASGTMLTSSDGINWSFESAVTTEDLYAIAYKN